MESLEGRIGHLERAARIHRLVPGALAIALLAGMALELWRSRTAFLQTRQLSIVDDQGKVRVQLGSLGTEAYGLTLLDASGKARALLELQGDGSPGLVLVDRYGRALAELTVSADASKLVLQGRNGNVFRAPID
jgi:hypothetical protein